MLTHLTFIKVQVTRAEYKRQLPSSLRAEKTDTQSQGPELGDSLGILFLNLHVLHLRKVRHPD